MQPETGDSFIVTDELECELFVTGIDSIELNNGKKRKRMTLIRENWGFTQWTEGKKLLRIENDFIAHL